MPLGLRRRPRDGGIGSTAGPEHIVAIDGGGFSMEPDNPLMDDFVLSLSRREPARVCFIPTARRHCRRTACGYGVNEGAALHFRGSRFVEAVSTKPLARAYLVVRLDGRAVETPLPTRV